MVTWEFYFARRRVTDFRSWAVLHGITDHASLVKKLESIGTTIPSATDEKLFIPDMLIIPPVLSPNTHAIVTKPIIVKKVPIRKEPVIDHE